MSRSEVFKKVSQVLSKTISPWKADVQLHKYCHLKGIDPDEFDYSNIPDFVRDISSEIKKEEYMETKKALLGLSTEDHQSVHLQDYRSTSFADQYVGDKGTM